MRKGVVLLYLPPKAECDKIQLLKNVNYNGAVRIGYEN